MARFLRFLAAFLLWPFAWALLRVLLDCFGMIAESSDALFSWEAVAAFSGMGLFFLSWVALPRPVRLYVLGHELTHAVWGLAFGARVSRLKVGETGGSVRLTRSNVWITLAPYFFPFYTLVVVLVACLVRTVFYFSAGTWSLPCPPAWMFAVGFTWCFHFCFTLCSLIQRQPDILEYGRIFSWTLILILNVAGICLWLLLTTDLSAGTVLRQLSYRASDSYAALFHGATFLLHHLAGLFAADR